MTALRLEGIGVEIGSAAIVSNLSIECLSGEFVGLLGPNGSGKSSALRTVYRALAPSAGRILLDDTDLLRELSARQGAQRIATMTQEHSLDFAFSVREIVGTGLNPHKRSWAGTTSGDHGVISFALDAVSMADHGHRPYSELSGGEKQRVLLARCLAQQPQVLILDEPTNHLDIATQLALMDLVRSLGLTVLVALHDLNLAAAYCDRIYLLRDGHLVCSGEPRSVLTAPRIAEVFGVRAHCGTHPFTGRLLLAFDPLP
jgi:iron complex transport system ATP-binding protein